MDAVWKSSIRTPAASALDANVGLPILLWSSIPAAMGVPLQGRARAIVFTSALQATTRGTKPSYTTPYVHRAGSRCGSVKGNRKTCWLASVKRQPEFKSEGDW